MIITRFKPPSPWSDFTCYLSAGDVISFTARRSTVIQSATLDAVGPHLGQAL